MGSVRVGMTPDENLCSENLSDFVFPQFFLT